MSPFDLSEEEWAEVKAQLPDVTVLCTRIATNWPYPEWLSDFTDQGQIKVSNVCFRDAGECLGYANLSLGMAIGVRKHYMDRRQNDKDPDHVSADEWSRFYAAYTPLWLAATVEHSLTGICRLCDVNYKNYGRRHDYKLKRVLQGVQAEQPLRTSLIAALVSLNENTLWKEIVVIRNNWSHNEPPRVETIMYDPPRGHKVEKLGGITMTAGGVVPSPKYSWEKFVEILKGGVGICSALEKLDRFKG